MLTIYDIVHKYIKSIKYLHIFKCYECSKYTWLSKLIDIEACADSCCYKMVCKSGCNFILDCGCNYKISCPYTLSDQYVHILCYKCNKTTLKELFWYGLSRYEYMEKYDS